MGCRKVMVGVAVALLCVGGAAQAGVVFSADFESTSGYTAGLAPTPTALGGAGLVTLAQPAGHGAAYWDAIFGGASDAYVVAGVGKGGGNAGAWTWNYTGGDIVASDVYVHGLGDPGRGASVEYRMDVNFASAEHDYAIIFAANSASGTMFTVRFGNGYYLDNTTAIHAGLNVGDYTQTADLSAGTFSANAYHTVVATVKYDVQPSGLKDTVELSVDNVRVVAPLAFNAGAIDNFEVNTDGNSSAAFGPIYVDNLSIQTAVPEPATMAFLALGGLTMMGGGMRRRRRA
ncbi:MAG: PEP-CTERM sorting domain-containing protein [Phycisphaerae bacterium]|nr:PEP-CTERM sorting domain-containing protein [Phycisphaerae bacterium]